MTKFKNLKRKTTLKNYNHLNKDNNDDVVFIKQVPVHPKNRMKKLASQNDKVEFMKQVPLHPRLCLKRKATLNNYRLLNKNKSKSDHDDDVAFIKKVPLLPRDRMKRLLAENDKVAFIKQVPLHPRGSLGRATKKLKEVQFINQMSTHPWNRTKRKEKEIAAENTKLLLNNKFDFSPNKILNKVLLFDTSRVNNEVMMDKIINAQPKDNDDYYIEHPIDLNYIILRREDGR